MDVVVVGSANVDLSIEVDRLPGPGETVLGHSLSRGAGGKGANQAAAASRLGAKTALVGRVGDDTDGAWLRDELAGRGVDVDALVVDPDALTGVAMIVVDRAGTGQITVAPMANGGLTAADIDGVADRIAGARVVLAQLEVPLAAVRRAFELARAAGAVTILNPAPAEPFDRELAAFVDILVPNQHELGLLMGSPVTDAGGAVRVARQFMEMNGCGEVIVTLGGDGAVSVARDRPELVVDAFAVPVVDTTAAGDAFCGALAAAVAEGVDRPLALRRACAAGALAATRRGALASLPSRHEVDRLAAV